MSFNYWDMKLAGGMVYHKGKVKMIESLSFNEEGWEDAGIEAGAFPEDYLPYITFHLGGGDEAEFEELEIKFPDDQWYLTADNKASCMSRKMTRQYKIAPTGELYDLTIHQGLASVMALCDGMKYNTPNDLWDWTNEDKVFSKSISLVRNGRNMRDLMYNEAVVGKMTRGKKWVRLEPTSSLMPKQMITWWGSKFGAKVPAPEDTTAAQVLDPDRLSYRWLKTETRPALDEDRGTRSYYAHVQVPGSYAIAYRIGSRVFI